MIICDDVRQSVPFLRYVAYQTVRCLVTRFLSRSAVLVAGLAVCASTTWAQDRQPGVSIGLNRVVGSKIGLLVLPMASSGGDSLATILSRDLDYSDRFQMVATSSVAGPIATGPAAVGPMPAANYPLYAKLGADGVVQGTLLPSGWLRIALHDIARKTVINQKDFPLPSPAFTPSWRMAAHGVSDAIEEWIVGQRGIAQTRIAFVRAGRVWTIDSDGANVIPVTPSGLSPQWVPSGRGLVYSVLDGVRDPLMYLDLATGAQRVLAMAPGTQNFSPAVSPDGRSVLFARALENGTDLYSIPIEGGTPRRITVGRGRISVQPSFSPDGQRIVFTSDRSGRSDVYISDVDGTNAEVLSAATFGDRGNRTGPDWSPDGRLVAFQTLNDNSKQIMTISMRDQTVRAVATEGRNDDPSWAPDSRHVVFTSDRSGVKQLWITDVESGRTRQLRTPSESRLAAWSPRLPTP